MLKSLLKINEMPKHLDASDGLAAAVCHFFQKDIKDDSTSYSGWDAFVKKNPGRTR